LHAGVVIHGPDSAILEANKRARELLGLRDLEGRLASDPQWQFLEIDHSPMSLDRFPVVQVITTRGPVRGMIGITKPPEGPMVWVEINALPVIDDAGELGQVVVTFIDVTDRIAAEQELLHLATHDPLTGLANRAALLDEIGRRMHDQDAYPAMVAFVDLDRFRVINDSLGHRGGDDLLVQVATRLTERLGPGEMLGRIGGDEFVVILGDDPPDTCVERLLSSFDEPFLVADSLSAFSASIGVAQAGVGTRLDAADLLDRADTAMFAANHDAAARWRTFDTALHDEAVRHVAVAEELRVALAEGRIRPDFQPVYSLTDSTLIGVEALARWHRPDGSVWLPAMFLDVCASSGQLVELGRQILDQACELVAASEIEPRPWLAVNVAAQQLVSHHFPDHVFEILERHHFAPEELRLEITEAYVLDDVLAPLILGKLHALGIGLTIDDFGTGWSSLSRLATLPVSSLKIDRQFVSMADADPASGRHRDVGRSARSGSGNDVGGGRRRDGCPTEHGQGLGHRLSPGLPHGPARGIG
jgi:diguanylate cyclase (GGDEF)-like protein/PAS domain S-box-containing protein